MTTSERPAMPAAFTETVPISCPEPTGRVAGAVSRLSLQRAKVFEFVRANPHATARECADAIGMSVGAVRQQRGYLRSSGLIPGRVVRELSPQRARVFEYMSANPRATAKECASATGISFGAVRQQQLRLRTAGLIPPAPAGASRAGSARSLVACHETCRARIRSELEVIAAGEGGLHALLEPALRRRQRAKLRRLHTRLRHHESRLAVLLEMLVREGVAP